MKKLKDNTITPAEEALLDIAGKALEAQHRKEYAPESGNELEQEVQQAANELTKALSIEECHAVGVPAVEVKNSNQGGFSAQLKDTTKSPNIVNATAHAERMHLAREVRCTALAADISESVDPQNSMERGVCNFLAATESLAMKFLAKAQDQMHKPELLYDKKSKPFPSMAAANAVSYANSGNKLIKTYLEAALILAKLRGGGQQQVTVVHQHVQVAGGSVAVAGNVTQGGDKDGE